VTGESRASVDGSPSIAAILGLDQTPSLRLHYEGSGIVPSDVTKPTPVVLPDALGWTRWGSLVTLVSGVLMFALLWGQNHYQVLHPHYLPFIVLITLMTVAAAIALDSGLWYAIRDRQRMSALAWMVLALIPMLFFGFVGLYAMVEWGDRRVPNNLPMNLAKVFGVTLMRLEASIECPNRPWIARTAPHTGRPRP